MFNSIYKKGNKKTAGPLMPSTLYKIQNVISKGLGQAVANRYITENPAHGLVLPPLNSTEIKFFTPNELRILGGTLPENSFGTLIAVLIETGLRIGEILALELKDIDFRRKLIFINKSVSYTKNKITGQMEFIVDLPKTKHSIRMIHITPRLEFLLIKQIAYLQIAEQEGGEKTKVELLFPAANKDYHLRYNVRGT